MTVQTIDALGEIASRYAGSPKPVNYALTAAGSAALAAAGPPCQGWIAGKPCLRDAGHHGACNPDPHGRCQS